METARKLVATPRGKNDFCASNRSHIDEYKMIMARGLRNDGQSSIKKARVS